MADIRLKTEKYTVDGREYELRCNMNVLADVQEANNGDLLGALDRRKSLNTALLVGAAMLNDYADECGLPERFTAKSLGRKISPSDMMRFAAIVSDLLFNALKGDGDEKGDGPEKN